MVRAADTFEPSGEGIPAVEAGAGAAQGRAFRSTWIVSSLESLRGSVHWPRYLVALTDHREEVLTCVAGAWCPMPVARSHYAACDALGLCRDEVMALFDGQGNRIRRAWYAPLIALAKGASSPWEILACLEGMWLRSCDAGAVVITRRGDREAHIEFVGCELFEIPYFRESVRAVLFALLGHVRADRAVEVLPQKEREHGCFAVQWAAGG
jgi:hypothetical protein